MYIRLLSYENACKLVDFVTQLNDIASITYSCVELNVTESNWDKVIDFLDSLEVRYELSAEPAYIVENLIEKSFLNPPTSPPTKPTT